MDRISNICNNLSCRPFAIPEAEYLRDLTLGTLGEELKSFFLRFQFRGKMKTNKENCRRERQTEITSSYSDFHSARSNPDFLSCFSGKEGNWKHLQSARNSTPRDHQSDFYPLPSCAGEFINLGVEARCRDVHSSATGMNDLVFLGAIVSNLSNHACLP